MPIPATSHLDPPKSWDEFEDICADLFAEEWDNDVSRHGRGGQQQDGVDIYGTVKGRGGAGVQCKGKRRWPPTKLTIAEIDADVASALKFRPKLAELIIATTAANDAKVQRHARLVTEHHAKRKLFSVHVLGWEELTRRLTKHGKLLEKYYGYVSIGSVRYHVKEIRKGQKDSATRIDALNASIKQLWEFFDPAEESDVARKRVRGGDARPWAARSVAASPVSNTRIQSKRRSRKAKSEGSSAPGQGDNLAPRIIEELANARIKRPSNNSNSDTELTSEFCKELVKEIANEFCQTTKLIVIISDVAFEDAFGAAMTSVGYHNIPLRQLGHLKIAAHVGFWISRFQPIRVQSPTMISSAYSLISRAAAGLRTQRRRETSSQFLGSTNDYKNRYDDYMLFPINEYVAMCFIQRVASVIWAERVSRMQPSAAKDKFEEQIAAMNERFWAGSQEFIRSLRYHTYTPQAFSTLIKSIFQMPPGGS